jgi:hypothetical protein
MRLAVDGQKAVLSSEANGHRSFAAPSVRRTVLGRLVRGGLLLRSP